MQNPFYLCILSIHNPGVLLPQFSLSGGILNRGSKNKQGGVRQTLMNSKGRMSRYNDNNKRIRPPKSLPLSLFLSGSYLLNEMKHKSTQSSRPYKLLHIFSSLLNYFECKRHPAHFSKKKELSWHLKIFLCDTTLTKI